MAPVEDNDSGMESQEGSQALDDTIKLDDFSASESKPREIEAAEEDEVFRINFRMAISELLWIHAFST